MMSSVLLFVCEKGWAVAFLVLFWRGGCSLRVWLVKNGWITLSPNDGLEQYHVLRSWLFYFYHLFFVRVLFSFKNNLYQ
jgi:hypothetical protein